MKVALTANALKMMIRYTLFITTFLSVLALLVSLWLWRRRSKAELRLAAYGSLTQHKEDNILVDEPEEPEPVESERPE